MSELLANVEESAKHSLLILCENWWCPQRESNPHSFEIDFECGRFAEKSNKINVL